MSADPKVLRRQAAGGVFCIIPYNHPDFAWTHHREWHEERYAVSTAEALDLMRECPEFRFCVEPWIDHIEPFLERCPDRIEELRKRLNSGQMGVKAFTLTSPRPATCADETFLRNMILGRRRYREFAPKADLSVMACPDVAIGHSQMPQVVRLAGARLYRGWRSDSAFNYLKIPREFIWRGLDGTELITSRGTYGGLVSTASVPDDVAGCKMPEDMEASWEETVARLFATELFRAMECSHAKTWWVSQGMDDVRPLRSCVTDKVLPIIELVRLWNEREASRMVLATPNEFRARIEKEKLPVWDGVIDQVDVAYNSGWHGRRGLWRLRQELDAAAVIAERACALARLQGGKGVADCARLEALWVEVVRAASHALQWIFEKDWEWLNSKARNTLRELREETAKAVTVLFGTGRTCAETGRPLVLFNPLPYPRDELVEVPWVQPRLDVGGHRVWDADGNEVALQLGELVGESWGGRIVEAPLVFAAQVPALGCAVYRVGDAPVAERPAPPPKDTLENGALRLRVGGRGLQEVMDLASGLKWRAPLASCIGDCRLHEMGPGVLHVGPITGELSGQTGQGKWVLAGPCRWVYRWECAFHGQRVRQDVIVDKDARYIDFVTRVFCPGANGFFALCFDLPFRGKLDVDIPFGVEPRNLEDEVYASTLPEGFQNIERHRDHQFWARSWASVSDGKRGVALITVDGDKYWTYDPATGRLRHILFTPLNDAESGWEAWVTKDRLALGWHEFRHRLVFHDGDWKAADLCGASDRVRLPLQVVKPLGARGKRAAPAVSGLQVTPESVRLSAFHEVPGGFVLRVYESKGETAKVRVELPCAFSRAVRTDFNLEPVKEKVKLADRALTLTLRRWEIATVLLTR
ncbi:MAG: hypothetical protein A3K19_26710 [Lentisphaerae bacterium RIFOXYB12_FULL_65_16]|nr:MAG: hypothetical protein A3K18_00890 [Lentisphaerae bacterium RIFOXYA12_64_32]OGV84358.1 MAG: hypothetical protein A3K19_26710 [Lentisphaerae bacterium RIFOXYB12_FULL_65_16]